ncbi:MAG: tRNA 2-thiouridine(34) synthase MnmA [Ruminococcaceae bacterium]|nr:tRNA 2-thiouridine(34) synthase MnmA [Oscillospiraceae bacterium]
MKIAVAMSGGVDSSVAAYLLKARGDDICGVTFRINKYNAALDIENSCLSNEDTEFAKSVADRLGIEYHVLNYGENFRRDVLDRFVCTYIQGGTPNPCIDCNRHVKFGALLSESAALGYPNIATGHYAKIEYDSGSGRYLLKRANDTKKDQTYMLYTLTQDRLSRIVFPLGEYTKAQIREIAAENGFENANRRDSQDICFVPDGDYAAFIEKYTGKKDLPGNFIDCEGNVLGVHNGIMHYTIGQGKHLGISIGRKAFVTAIDPETRNITLGDNSMLFKKELVADDVNIIVADRLDTRVRVSAKIRYSAKEALAWAVQDDNGLLHIEFDEPQRAITKGQAVVMYDGDTVIGGGRIL